MQKYNHELDSIDGSTGVNVNEVMPKALNIVLETDLISRQAELFEKVFSGRELAVIGAIALSKGLVTPLKDKFLDTLIKEGAVEDDCECPDCVARREREKEGDKEEPQTESQGPIIVEFPMGEPGEA